jgi:hypothetical protein
MNEEIANLLRKCRTQIRDGIIMCYRPTELCESPETTIENINKVLGEKYNIETAEVVE